MKQLSIFIENKSGTLLNILNVMKNAEIPIIASMVADTQDFGIYRVVCDNPDKAYSVLKNEGMAVTMSEVFAIVLEDKPGEAANVVSVLTEGGISISYIYSFLVSGKGILVFRTSDTELTKKIIKEKGLHEFA